MNDDANVGIQKKELLVVHTRIILCTYIYSVNSKCTHSTHFMYSYSSCISTKRAYICIANSRILISMIIKKQLCLICFLLIHIIKGQAQDISFRHLTTDDGLSHNAVMTMYQDERGFIWIGTRNGPIYTTDMNSKYTNLKKTIRTV
jgi:hypothetical protein